MPSYSADPRTRPGGNYRPALIASGPMLHLAGQTARRGDSLVATGIVGNTVDIAAARECARQCADNLLAHAEHAVGDMTRIRRVVRLTVYVAATPEFYEHSVVGDAASDRLIERLGDRGVHVRSTVGVNSLPRLSPVEIDADIELYSHR